MIGDDDEPQRAEMGASSGPSRAITSPVAGRVAEAVDAGVTAAQGGDAVHGDLEDEQAVFGEIPGSLVDDCLSHRDDRDSATTGVGVGVVPSKEGNHHPRSPRYVVPPGSASGSGVW
jgi:hypothetical protein